ncbi:hypothetical protein [Citricoccus sp. NR2]|uniref:hypothetical protein n=1 Tax=Citricoccus sp. NR2 TaxID=3004095 RepID=UPI0022DE925F|nr:hypothetical protein [Citricoccus sp. NR2]WBL20109.1 hypothetical protein O1A05_05360 [Citricoccus sp. NR2]
MVALGRDHLQGGTLDLVRGFGTAEDAESDEAAGDEHQCGATGDQGPLLALLNGEAVILTGR